MHFDSPHSIKADRNLIVIVGSIVMSSQMSDFGVSLSWAAIKNVVIEKMQEDFAFIVGDKWYNCASIISRFVPSNLVVAFR
jgi:hypothetical protein